jgi:hypothetical protein
MHVKAGGSAFTPVTYRLHFRFLATGHAGGGWGRGPGRGAAPYGFQGAGHALSLDRSMSLPSYLPATGAKQTTCSLYLINSNNALYLACSLEHGLCPGSPESCAPAARSLKSPQNLPSLPAYYFIKAVLTEPLQNQHFHNC